MFNFRNHLQITVPVPCWVNGLTGASAKEAAKEALEEELEATYSTLC